MHVKAIKIRAKIKDQQKENNQCLVRPNMAFLSGVAILSRGRERRDVVWRRRRLLSCLLGEVLCVGKGLGFNHKIMINVLGVAT
jgi:hypothetical protein